MLKSILNFDGAQELGKEERKRISGGFSGFGGICPNEGDACGEDGHYFTPFTCLAGPLNLCCKNGVLISVLGDNCYGI